LRLLVWDQCGSCPRTWFFERHKSSIAETNESKKRKRRLATHTHKSRESANKSRYSHRSIDSGKQTTYPYEGAKLGMLEKLRYDQLLKIHRILHDKGFPIFGPTRNCWVTGIHHLVRLCSKKGEREKDGRRVSDSCYNNKTHHTEPLKRLTMPTPHIVDPSTTTTVAVIVVGFCRCDRTFQ
jgi:hypothetical protein